MRQRSACAIQSWLRQRYDGGLTRWETQGTTNLEYHGIGPPQRHAAATELAAALAKARTEAAVAVDAVNAKAVADLEALRQDHATAMAAAEAKAAAALEALQRQHAVSFVAQNWLCVCSICRSSLVVITGRASKARHHRARVASCRERLGGRSGTYRLCVSNHQSLSLM